MAVQTLRNQVMAATFLASTTILISLGSFSAAFRPGVFMEVSHTLNLMGTKTETLWMFKLIWHARLLPVGAAGLVAVRPGLDAGGQPDFGCRFIAPGS